jgi:hypothetical protein
LKSKSFSFGDERRDDADLIGYSHIFLANGTASKNYGVFLVQLLRLRQCTSHPFMLEHTIKNCWTSLDLEELKRRLKSLGEVKVPFYEQCQVWVTQSKEERQAATARGEDPELQGVEREKSMRFGAGDFGHSFEMGKALKTLSEEDMYSRNTCSLCSDLPRVPMLTDVRFSLPSSESLISFERLRLTGLYG